MNPENLICLGSGFAFGAAAFFVFALVRAKFRERRLRDLPHTTILFRI